MDPLLFTELIGHAPLKAGRWAHTRKVSVPTSDRIGRLRGGYATSELRSLVMCEAWKGGTLWPVEGLSTRVKELSLSIIIT